MSRMDTVGRLDRLMGRKNGLAQRAAAAPLAERLRLLRAWQAARLAHTYADLRLDPLAADALGFFMSDLYGPQDLTRRDQDVARAWRLLKRTLPPRMLAVLAMTMELDVLSAELDLEVAERLPPGPLTAPGYSQAYRAVGRPEARRRQIGLIGEIGNALGRAVKTPLVGLGLRAAHGPAHLAGFGVLQDFLERGYAAFRRLPRPARLLTAIEQRETHLMQILFAGGTISWEESPAGASESG